MSALRVESPVFGMMAQQPRRLREDRPNKPPVRRRLDFGEPLDHDDLQRTLERERKKLSEQDKQRWNFDFDKDEPLPGNYSWEKVQSGAMPVAYGRMLSRLTGRVSIQPYARSSRDNGTQGTVDNVGPSSMQTSDDEEDGEEGYDADKRKNDPPIWERVVDSSSSSSHAREAHIAPNKDSVSAATGDLRPLTSNQDNTLNTCSENLKQTSITDYMKKKKRRLSEESPSSSPSTSADCKRPKRDSPELL